MRGLANLGSQPQSPSQAVIVSPAPMRSQSTAAPRPGMPTWDEQEKFDATRRRLLFLVAVIIAMWGVLIGLVFLGPAIPQGEVKPLEIGANLTMILAPILAASAAVERLLETVFNLIENNWLTLVAYLGRGLRWLKSAETELQQARQWVSDVSERYTQEAEGLEAGLDGWFGSLTKDVTGGMDQAQAIMDMADQRLAKAEQNLVSVTSSLRYKSAKATASVILGLMLGVIVADLGSLRMFALLGIGTVPAKLDVFITGLVIGSGSYPVHSLVGFLQQFKDVLNSTRGALSRANTPAGNE
jgi:exonuclease VII small subunit